MRELGIRYREFVRELGSRYILVGSRYECVREQGSRYRVCVRELGIRNIVCVRELGSRLGGHGANI